MVRAVETWIRKVEVEGGGEKEIEGGLCYSSRVRTMQKIEGARFYGRIKVWSKLEHVHLVVILRVGLGLEHDVAYRLKRMELRA
ncbi:hypothetical protein RYX36_026724 [Vicia faba]